ncbi:MAG: hypothetical protein Kow0031_10070 [Anaerolineae bacterium]
MEKHPEVVYWLALTQHSGLKLNIIKPIILRWCLQERRPLSALFELSPLEMGATFGLSEADADQILAVPARLPEQAALLARWQQQGIHLLARTDPRYPRRLAHALSPAKQPLLLWAEGRLELLNQPLVNLLGQPGQDKSAADFIAELVGTLEQEGIGLVSGYSRGLDRDAFDLMLASATGFAVALLPMGLAAFAQTTATLAPAVEAGRAALVSPFAPDTPYQERLAEARTLLIDHLSLALLIPDADDDAQSRATQALDRGLPVFVKENTPGNHQLIDQGALLLTDAGEVVDWVQQALVDDVLLDTDEEAAPEAVSPAAAAPLTDTAPVAPPRSDEDFKLRVEDVPLLDSDEAIEVLSMGGDLPEVLRDRLKKRQKPSE